MHQIWLGGKPLPKREMEFRQGWIAAHKGWKHILWNEDHIEKHLGFNKATIVYDYPSSQAALAQKKKSEPFFTERFELYIAGVELANAFSELIDADEQRERLIEEQNLRKNLNKTVFDIDEEFLASLESIIEPCSGIALGIDRLLMILLNKSDIKDVILFPLENYLNK